MPGVVTAITSIATAIGGWLAGGGFIKALLGTLFNVGISLLERALQKKNQQQDAPVGISGQIQVGGDNPISFIVGQYATAGSLEYANTWGSDGKTPNAYCVQVISLSDMPSAGLADVFVDGDAATLVLAEPHPVLGYPVFEYRVNGKDHLWVKFHDGSQTTADSYLTFQFGAIAGRPWTSDMIGRGVTYAVVTSLINRDLFKDIPKLLFVVNGMKLYDIRKDSTAGGSGSHRWSTPSTWEWTANPAIIAYNIMRGVYYGSTWVYGMQDLPALRLPAASWMAAMNACAASVSLAGGGTEARYRAGAEIFVDRPAIDVVEEILKTCNARIAEIGGVFKITVDVPASGVYSFTDEDIVVSETQQFDPFPGLESTYNGVHASYPEPAEVWANKDAPPRYSTALETTDDGRRLIAAVQFPYVPYKYQVQRLMLSLIQNERRFRKHIIVLPPEAWLLEPNDVVEWTSTRNGYDTKLFIVMAVDGAPNYNQTVVLLEVDPSDYDWSTDFELPTSTGYVGKIKAPAQPITAFFVEPVTVVGSSGKRRAAIRLEWDGDQPDVQAVQYQVRLRSTAQVVIANGRTTDVDRAVLDESNVFSSTAYQVRARYEPFSGRQTLWSDWLNVTTDAVPYSDILATLEQINQDVKKYLQERHQEFEDQFEQINRNLINLLGLATDSVKSQTIFTSNFGRLKVSFKSEVALRTTQYELIGQRFDTLEGELTTVDNRVTVTATVVDQMQVQITNINGQLTSQADDLRGVRTDLSGVDGRVTALTASGGVIDQLTSRIRSIDGPGGYIQSNNSRVTAAESRVGDLAGKIGTTTIPPGGLSKAVDSLNTAVNVTLAGEIDVIASRTSLVEARTGRASAQGLFDVRSTVKPTGTNLRLQFGGRVTEGATTQWAGGYLDVTAAGSQWVFDSTKFIITNNTGKYLPFVFSAGVLRLGAVMVGSANIDVAAIKRAHIGVLEVDTIHIKHGAVSRRAGNRSRTGTIYPNINVSPVATLEILPITIPSQVAVNLQLAWNYYIQVSKTGATITGSVRVKRNGVIVANIGMSAVQAAGAGANGSQFRHVLDFPPSTGTYTYTVEHLATVVGQSGGSGQLRSTINLQASWNLV